MHSKRHILFRFVSFGFTSLLWIVSWSACTNRGSEAPAIPLPSQTAMPILSTRVQTGAPLTPSPSPTLTEMEKEYYNWLASRPLEMESYGFIHDPEATPVFPPRDALNFPIWGQSLPLVAFDHEPHFVSYAPPDMDANIDALLREAGCPNRDYWEIQCQESSPLLDFECESLYLLRRYHLGSTPDYNVVALCTMPPSDDDTLREGGLFRIGCAFRKDAAFVVEREGRYELIQTNDQVRDLLLPIDSPEKALDYAQMTTGLSPIFSFEAEPELLYFQDPIEGTRVTEVEGIYTINLFHRMGCMCEPWVNTEIYLQVDRAGELTFIGGLPISMTIGMSCVD